MPLRGGVIALGFPPVIMMMRRMSFVCARNSHRATSSPSAILVWEGPTCALANRANGMGTQPGEATPTPAEPKNKMDHLGKENP